MNDKTIQAIRDYDRRYELYDKANAVLRCIRAAAFNEKNPADGDAIANAAWAVEGMLEEMQEIADRHYAAKVEG